MKICKITAALCLLFGLPLIAQVQLGRNVQVGAGSGSGATLPTNAITYGTSSTTSRAATATDITNLVQSSTGCTTSGNFWEPASGTCIAVGGGISGQTVTCAVKAASATTSTSSLPICDDGTTLTISHPTTFNDGSGKAAFFGLKQGTAQSTVTGEIGFTAPTSVTAYNMLWPGAQWTGCLSDDGSGNLSGVSCGGGGSLPTATAPGQIISSTAAGTTYAVQPQIFYSQSGDTVASIETECSSACTYVVTAPQTITLAADHGMSGNVHLLFQAGGKWTVNGAFTLSNIQVETASALSQHFAGSSTLALALSVNRVPVEWFGAVGYSTVPLAIASSTDDAAAMNKAVTSLGAGCIALGGQAYPVASAVAFTTSGKGICGEVPGYHNAGTPTNPVSIIVNTTATTNTVTVSNNTAYNVFKDFSLHRAVLATGSAKGFSEDVTCGVTVSNVQSFDSISDFYFHDAPSCAAGGIFHTQAGWGYAEIPISAYTSGTYVGYELDSEDGVAENTIYLSYAAASGNGTMPGGIDKVATIHGQAINDVDFFQVGGAFTNYGIDISYDGTGLPGTASDIHIVEPTMDSSIGTALRVSNIPFSAGWAGIVAHGGFLGAADYAVDVENSTLPISIEDSQLYAGGGLTSTGPVLINASSNVSVQNNMILGGGAGETAAYFVSLAGATNNSITGNQFIGAVGFAPPSMVKLASTSTLNTIQANRYSGYATAGITLDTTSQNNTIGPEQIDPAHVTTPYVGFTSQNTNFPNTITCNGGPCSGATGFPLTGTGVALTNPSSGVIAVTGPGGGVNGTINFGSLFGNFAAVLYDAGAAHRYGWGLTSSTMNFAVPSTANSGGTFAFENGGELDDTKSFFLINDTVGTRMSSALVMGWTSVSTDVLHNATDTGLSRESAGVLDVGNGTAGDKSGVLNAIQFNSYQAGTGTGFGLHAQSAATSGANQAAGNLAFYGNYWNGTASTSDIWTFAPTLGTGTNPISTLFLTHSGTPGVAAVGLPMTAAVLYSAAGNPLPACASALNGYEAVVTDATTPTYMGAYTSGGLITAKVICSYNGTTYSWLTH